MKEHKERERERGEDERSTKRVIGHSQNSRQSLATVCYTTHCLARTGENLTVLWSDNGAGGFTADYPARKITDPALSGAPLQAPNSRVQADPLVHITGTIP